MDGAEPGFRYWAFISYSHQDHAWGSWLHRAIEGYRIPSRLVGRPIAAGTVPARLNPVFLDRDELPTATDLGRSVADALAQSWCLVVVCSRASAQSRWVNEEVREFQSLGRQDRIHCLLVDDPASARCFPPALCETRADGKLIEPIAADPRRHGDGRAHARLKLTAGILGLSYDRLVQRDQHRAHKRMVVLATSALLAAAVLAVSTIVAIRSRHDAEMQRGHAESLVEFMLGDLRQKLEPEGQLSTLDAVGKEALAYYAAQDPATLDANALARRARALHLIGEVDDQRGHLDDALGVFKQAAASTAELLARDARNPQRIFDHAQSVFWVGSIAHRRGQTRAAETAFDTYKALATELVAIDPNNADWQAELEYADSNLGTLMLDQGRADEAAGAFESALGVAIELARRAPNDLARRTELAQAHAWLGDARSAQGRFADAIAERQAEIGISEEILAENPKNRSTKNALLVAEHELGRLSMMRGDLPMALSELARAVALGDELRALAPDNTTIASDSAAALTDQGHAMLAAGDNASARVALGRARELATQLVARDPSVLDWQARLSATLLLHARVQALDRDPLGALRQIQGVIQRIDTLRGTHPLDLRTRILYAKALLMAASQNAALGDSTQAAPGWQRVIDFLHSGAGGTSPPAQAMLACAQLALGRKDEAAPLLAHLDRIGYREADFLNWRAAADTRAQVPATASAH